MSKFVKLLTSAYVNGVLRHPHEGVLHLEDDEADRLIRDEAGEDVTKDFSADDRKEVPVEGLRASDNDAAAAAKLGSHEHLANVSPNTTEEGENKPAAKAKAGTAKE